MELIGFIFVFICIISFGSFHHLFSPFPLLTPWTKSCIYLWPGFLQLPHTLPPAFAFTPVWALSLTSFHFQDTNQSDCLNKSQIMSLLYSKRPKAVHITQKKGPYEGLVTQASCYPSDFISSNFYICLVPPWLHWPPTVLPTN